MKYFTFDSEEEKILNDFENDTFVPVKETGDVQASYHAAATATLHRTRQINIRISERDLQKLKAKAVEKGIPYQTLVSSILHQYGSS